MTLAKIEILFLIFFIYSIGGWLIESVGGIFTKKKFVNRGFLMGPYCPIYGVGVVLITLFLSKYHNDVIALFLLSAVLCGTLEYLTSYIMEKLFKARWWDYSNMKYNINGRICLETLVWFAIAGVVIIHWFNPALQSLLLRIPEVPLHIITGILASLFFIDCIISLNVINSVKSIKVTVTNQVKDNTDEISKKVREIVMEKSLPYRRLISAFPQAFADKLKESKEKIEKTAEKVKENIQDVKENIQDAKEKALDNIQNVKEKTFNNIQNMKDKTIDNIQNIKDKTIDSIQNIKDKTIDTISSRDKSLNKGSQDKNNNSKKFLKRYKTNIKLSLMNIYKNK